MSEVTQHEVPELSDTLIGTPVNLEARQILDRAQHELFGDASLHAGRYEIVRKLGAGGMGVVYEAYDLVLDCRVALKQLRPELAAAPGFLERLRREARAMAKLRAEPRVVTLYDYFVQDAAVFVVMEFVDGTTLRGWQEAPRSWMTVLDHYLQAGRGLAAAHRAELVHRDFKPENVMIGRDGRVRVMDFGLARSGAGEPVDLRMTLAGPREASAASETLTQDGEQVGTPLYMAPEQWLREPTDARTDQWSYCVALWEALYRAPPFVGSTLPELASQVMAGRLPPAPAGSRVPAWLRRILQRGLQGDPGRRWPDMVALLQALAGGRARVRAQRVLAGVGVVALLAVGAWLWREHARGERVAACAASGAASEGTWSAERGEELRAALLATGASNASETYARAVPLLDRWSRGWAEARTGACLAAEVEGTEAWAPYERTVECLDEGRDELAARLMTLPTGGVAGVQAMIPALARMLPPAACREPATLALRPVLPDEPALRGRVLELRRTLATAEALLTARRREEGMRVAEVALTDSDDSGYAPISIRARLLVGDFAWHGGDLKRAEELYTRAYGDAVAAGLDDRAAAAALSMMYVVGHDQARYAEGLVWARSTEAFNRRGGRAEGLEGARYLGYLAAIREGQGDLAEALALERRGLEIRERVLGPEHIVVAEAQKHVAGLCRDLGEYAEALALAGRALALEERVLGPEHPYVATTLTTIALVYMDQGDDRALALLRRVVAIREHTLGPDHVELADGLSNLAAAYQQRGDLGEARALFEQVLEIWTKRSGREHPRVARALANLGSNLQDAGDMAGALALFREALAIQERLLGPDHADLAIALTNIGVIHDTRREYPEAIAAFERALPIWERSVGLDHMYPTYAQIGLARVLLASGRPEEAIPLLARAMAVRDRESVGTESRAEPRSVLARALWEAAPGRGGDRTRSLQMASEAITGYRAAGEDDYREEIDELAAWVAAHMGGR